MKLKLINSNECAVLFQEYSKQYKGTKITPAFCWEFMRDYLLPTQAKLTLQQVIDEIDYCRTLDELKQKLSEALK